MSKSLMDAMLLAMALDDSGPTQKQFGAVMHNDNVTEYEKQEVLQKVALLGGYANLFADDEGNN